MNTNSFKRPALRFANGEPGSSNLRGISSDANMKQLRAIEKLKNPHSVWHRKPKQPHDENPAH